MDVKYKKVVVLDKAIEGDDKRRMLMFEFENVEIALLEHFVRMTNPAKYKLVNCWGKSRTRFR